MTKLVKGAIFDGATIDHIMPVTVDGVPARRVFLSDGRTKLFTTPRAQRVTGRKGERFPAGKGTGSFGQARRVKASDTRLRGDFGERKGDRTTVRIAAWAA